MADAASDGSGLPSFRFPLAAQPARVTAGGGARGHSVANFPAGKNIAGVSMWLNPGGLRELHWHPNAAEWGYVLTNRCRITLFDPDGTYEAWDLDAGDVWYFPRGYGHAVQGLGPGDCQFLLLFDNGAFQEDATFSITDWLARTSGEALAKTFGVSAGTFDGIPKAEAWIVKGEVPKPLLVQGEIPSAPQKTPRLPHIFHLKAQEPVRHSGGTVRIVSVKEFPASTTMTGALMTIDPGALRALHWHPNADEWQYYIAGRARMTVFCAKGRSETVALGPGDVGYVPQGYGHCIENAGGDPCEILIGFNSGEYMDSGLARWMAGNPPQLVATNVGLPEDVIMRFRRHAVLVKG